MCTQTFYDWPVREIASSRMALIGLYEAKDRILYVDEPPRDATEARRTGTATEDYSLQFSIYMDD